MTCFMSQFQYTREENTRFNDGRHIIYVNCEYLKNHPEPENELDKLIHDMQCEDVNKIYHNVK